MDAKQLFFERYNGFREYPERLVDGMTEQQLRQSPHPTVNPIAWLLWHTARCEDLGVNRLLVDRRQVLDDGGWPSRLGLDLRQVGTGMTRGEVEELCERINLSALTEYRSSITDRTVEVVSELPSAALNETMGVEHLKQVFVDEGSGGQVAEWIVEAYEGQTKGWLLGNLVLTHNYYHIGQAFLARGIFGLPSPW